MSAGRAGAPDIHPLGAGGIADRVVPSPRAGAPERPKIAAACMGVLAASALVGPALAAPADAVLIPAGSFTQGSAQEPDAPVRTVTLGAYRIDRAEVTVAAFEDFAARAWSERAWWDEAGWEWAVAHPGGAGPALRRAGRPVDHPVVAVTWFEADAWCRAQGGALPTEAQWEHAAAGDGGRRFPWGDEERGGTWAGGEKYAVLQDMGTVAAGRQDPGLASPFGLVHMAGNVWEWTRDRYDRDGAVGDATDPTGPAEGPWRTLRGGSFTNLPSSCTTTHREPALPDRVALTTGFRCVYPP